MYDEEWEPELTGPQGLGLLAAAVAAALAAILPQATITRGALDASLTVLADRGWVALVPAVVLAALGVAALAQQWGWAAWLTPRAAGIPAAGALLADGVLWWPTFAAARDARALDGVGGVAVDYGPGLLLFAAALLAAVGALAAPTVRAWVGE